MLCKSQAIVSQIFTKIISLITLESLCDSSYFIAQYNNSHKSPWNRNDLLIETYLSCTTWAPHSTALYTHSHPSCLLFANRTHELLNLNLLMAPHYTQTTPNSFLSCHGSYMPSYTFIYFLLSFSSYIHVNFFSVTFYPKSILSCIVKFRLS